MKKVTESVDLEIRKNIDSSVHLFVIKASDSITKPMLYKKSNLALLSNIIVVTR